MVPARLKYILLVAAILGIAGCSACRGCRRGASARDATAGRPKVVRPEEAGERWGRKRRALVATLQWEGIADPRVLEAVARVPRHAFVPEPLRGAAYENHPLPIGHEQTISQPYIVALMTQLAEVESGDRVLEVGTGSGYQAAILAELTKKVYTIEIVAPLARRARATLEALGYGERIHFRVGDGYAGWPEAAPFDAIVVTAAPPKVPVPLKAQLALGGHLVIPVGRHTQSLRRLTRTAEGIQEAETLPVRFVPMTGKAQEGE